MMVHKSDLGVEPINWLGLHRQYLNAGEMEVIVALVRSVEARSMMEFGCRDGRTAQVLLQNVPTLERYVGVDVPMSYMPGLKQQRSEMVSRPGDLAASDPRFKLVIRERGTFDLNPHEFDLCDAVFVDGDHSEDMVAQDSHLARAMVRPEGLIVWHDYGNRATAGVRRVLDHLSNEGWSICVVKDTWLAFCRT